MTEEKTWPIEGQWFVSSIKPYRLGQAEELVGDRVFVARVEEPKQYQEILYTDGVGGFRFFSSEEDARSYYEELTQPLEGSKHDD